MVKLASDRSILTKALDSTWNTIKIIYFSMLLFIVTTFRLKKESNKYSKEELNYLVQENVPFKKQKDNDSDNDEDDKSIQKPKIFRGIGGNADCKK